jgi:hypothetical protein
VGQFHQLTAQQMLVITDTYKQSERRLQVSKGSSPLSQGQRRAGLPMLTVQLDSSAATTAAASSTARIPLVMHYPDYILSRTPGNIIGELLLLDTLQMRISNGRTSTQQEPNTVNL